VRDVQVLQSSPEQIWVQGLELGERVIVREPGMTIAGMLVEANSRGDLAVGRY
jgi:hypothetical protein